MHHMDLVQNVENTNAPPSALLAIVLLFIILYIQEKLNFTVNVTVKPFQVFLFYKIIVEAVHLLNVLIVTVHARLLYVKTGPTAGDCMHYTGNIFAQTECC